MEQAFAELPLPVSPERQSAVLQFLRDRLEDDGARDEEKRAARNCLDVIGDKEITLLDALVVAYVLNGGVMLCEPPGRAKEDGGAKQDKDIEDLEVLISELNQDI